MKDKLINVLGLALTFARCCNEYSDDYKEEEEQYEELLHRIKKENHQNFSKEEIEVILDACDNAFEEIDYSQSSYQRNIDDISDVIYKFRNLSC